MADKAKLGSLTKLTGDMNDSNFGRTSTDSVIEQGARFLAAVPCGGITVAGPLPGGCFQTTVINKFPFLAGFTHTTVFKSETVAPLPIYRASEIIML